jgi:hypothetical protein
MSSTGFTAGKSFEFTLAPEPGFAMDLGLLSFDELRTAAGPPTWRVLVVVDGVPHEIGSGAATEAVFGRHTVYATGAAAGPHTGPVEIRLFASGAGAGGGAWRIDNVTLEGRVVEVP